MTAGLHGVPQVDPEERLPPGALAGAGWTIGIKALDAERAQRLVINLGG